MNNIYYLEEEILNHYDGAKVIKSLLWKLMYKRVQKKLKKSTITVENVRKILHNSHNSIGCTIDAPLNYVMFRNEPIWYYVEGEREYYIPLSIGFANTKASYDIVLINGELDIRDTSIRRLRPKDRLSHSPVLSVKNFKIIEQSFKLLLSHIEKENELYKKDKPKI
ncbi:hypothetical protein CRU96_13125 [Malaciobacter halophilus]|nr:hypothetical protein [Malaciobacter halophilus]RYA22439.1 hypothetical protein CRU96_13125 [Malaciobacter halophilus]